MIPVKICGITTPADARVAVEAGASALGFIFYLNSPRHVSVSEATHIGEEIPSTVVKVGVFVNETLERVRMIADTVGLDFVQLHGKEPPDYCQQVGFPVIKAIRVGSKMEENFLLYQNVRAFLLDTYDSGQAGGTGKPFDWGQIPPLPEGIPLILAGGLTPDNVLEGIRVVQPAAIDVNSGVESAPGRKDPRKIRLLFEAVAETGTYHNLFDSRE
jgi:phosphoribosylanthranilate isomerase